MTDIRAHASGKVILLGEHAVVYGVPGLAAGIERGARATARALPAGAVSRLALGDARFDADPEGADLARAFAALTRGLAAPVDVHAEADLPPGGGLGCSAALAVAIARAAMGAAAGAPIDETDADVRAAVLERAAAWEGIFHGNPSGIDTAAAAIGTCLRFERGKGAKSLGAPIDLWLAVGNSGKGASTKEMVEGVARLKERKPELVDKFLAGVHSLVDNAALAIGAGDARALGKLLDLNQMLLAGVFLSTEPIEEMCAAARSAGALGAKLTGSGGGGCVIALGGASAPGARGTDAEATATRVVESWAAIGKTGFVTRIEASKEIPT
jgi:mevalonate kinase